MQSHAERAIRADWTVLVPTAFGWAGAAGRGEALVRLFLPEPGGKGRMTRRLALEYPGASFGKAPSVRASRELVSLVEGRGPGPETDLSGLTDFDREVLAWIGRIPRGSVATYGTIACWMGRPGSARAVGGASGRNPVPLAIPCHRVVGAGGYLVGFSASGGVELKRRLLEREGVAFHKGSPARVLLGHILESPPGRSGS